MDVGTSAVRATVLTDAGKPVASRSLPTPSRSPAAGEVTLDGEECWRAVAGAVAAVAPGHPITAVGVSAQLGTVLVDTCGRALSPIRLWADRSAAPWVDEVRDRLAGSLPVWGRPLAAELAAVRLRALVAQSPDLLERAHAIVSLKDYLVGRLTGEVVTDVSHASYTVLFDVPERRWSDDLLRRLDLPAYILPPVRRGDEPAGVVTADAAADCGLRPGVVVAVGGPDGTVGAIGAGATAPGRTVDIAGSTDVLVHVVDRPVLDPRQTASSNAHPLDRLWTVGGATGVTGGAIAWLSETLGHENVAALYAAVDATDATPGGPEGLLADPALMGHRFPYWDLTRGGGFHGLAPHHRAQHLVRALEEGAAFVVRDGLDAVRALGQAVERVVVVGGVARRPASLRTRAAVLGLPIEGVDDGLATSRGAALLAAVANGDVADAAEGARQHVAAAETYEPDAAEQRRLGAVREAWREAFGLRWMDKLESQSPAQR